jgi:hypothetical protein
MFVFDSPEKSEYGEVNLVAEMRIICIEKAVHFITTKLKGEIQEEGLFQSNAMKVTYPCKWNSKFVVEKQLKEQES